MVETKQEKAVKNRKKHRIILWGSLFLTALLAVVIFVLVKKQQRIVSFEGVSEIQDSIKAMVQDIPTFKFENTLAVNNTVNSVGGIIDNIESFKRTMTEELNVAETNNAPQIRFPSIGILFDFGLFDISTQGIELLEEFAKFYLKTNKEASLLIEGYTCDVGENDVNDILSRQRAEAVKRILVNDGVSEDKTEIRWFGESKYGTFNYATKKEYRRVNISIR